MDEAGDEAGGEDADRQERSAIRVDLSFERGQKRIPAARVRHVVETVLGAHGRRRGHIDVAIVGDETIARLHGQYLGDSRPTDVLTFDLGDSDETVEGQVVVSGETAAREAARRGVSFEAELMLYVVHGLLHLLGFRDDGPGAARRMHAEEDRLLEKAGYGRVYGASGDGGVGSRWGPAPRPRRR